MKMFLALILAVTIALVHSQACSMQSDCDNEATTTCGNGAMEHCRMGHCVCLTASGNTCTAQADCSCDHGVTAHCVDGHCHCQHHGGGGR